MWDRIIQFFRKNRQIEPALLEAQRLKVGDFSYSLGCMPTKAFAQVEGYVIEFSSIEPFDDRYRLDMMVSQEKIYEALVAAMKLLPAEVSMILERPTHDIYKEMDLYMSTEVPLPDVLKCLEQYRVIIEDEGFIGLGALSEDPEVEVFISDHKMITVFHPELNTLETLVSDLNLPSHDEWALYFDDEEHVHRTLRSYKGFDEARFDVEKVTSEIIAAFSMDYQDEDDDTDEQGEPMGQVPWLGVFECYRTKIDPAEGSKGKKEQKVYTQQFGVTATTRQKAIDFVLNSVSSDGSDIALVKDLFRVDKKTVSKHFPVKDDFHRRPGVWYRGRPHYSKQG